MRVTNLSVTPQYKCVVSESLLSCKLCQGMQILVLNSEWIVLMSPPYYLCSALSVCYSCSNAAHLNALMVLLCSLVCGLCYSCMVTLHSVSQEQAHSSAWYQDSRHQRNQEAVAVGMHTRSRLCHICSQVYFPILFKPEGTC